MHNHNSETLKQFNVPIMRILKVCKFTRCEHRYQQSKLWWIKEELEQEHGKAMSFESIRYNHGLRHWCISLKRPSHTQRETS